MCGRYVLKASPQELQRVFHLERLPDAFGPRYNIAPLQAAPILTDAAPRQLSIARWGLLPKWAKDQKIASRLINARSETISKRPAFKPLLADHRCLVPCDGFYEWKHSGRQRLPHFIHAASHRLLAMAGLWNAWHSPEGLNILTFTIITSRANPLVNDLHDRMPALLDEEGQARWLSGPTHDLPALEALLRPWHGEPLAMHEVSTRVNTPAVDDAQCLVPVASQQLELPLASH